MGKRAVSPEKGPRAGGPYSPAVVYSNLVFISGQVPLDPQTGKLVRGTLAEEAEVALTNLKTVLESTGSSLDHVLKVTLYLGDMDDFAKINEVYKKYFTGVFPARTCIQAGRLPFNVKVEVDAVAYLAEEA